MYRKLLPARFAFFGLIFLFVGIWIISGTDLEANQISTPKGTASRRSEPRSLSTSDLARYLSGLKPEHIEKQIYLKDEGGRKLKVTLSIDPGLQDYIRNLASNTKALQTSVVVMDAVDGRILAMVDYDQLGQGDIFSIKADYPAASIFKMVSAAAALEAAGFSPEQSVSFVGGQHTLYKYQLKDKSGKYTTKTTFRKAFASSINPVFGKLGIYHLGRGILNDYGSRFYFNRAIPFEMEMGKSRMEAPSDNFGLAELASGFNKETLISPLHAAMLGASVANDGVMMRPRIVETVQTESGITLYEGKSTALARVIKSDTATGLKVLMRETVVRGTCKRAFHKLFRSKACRDVDLGAKTGTINDRLDRFKYDWTVAFAAPRDGRRAIAVAVLNVHGEKLGLRANETASIVINRWIK
jgi:cell division protein FtsI/penicillin-binding protein 2